MRVALSDYGKTCAQWKDGAIGRPAPNGPAARSATSPRLPPSIGGRVISCSKPDLIGEYISTLANVAALASKAHGHVA